MFPKFRGATMILEECERRYAGFTRRAIEIRLPFFKGLDASKVKAVIHSALNRREWPEHLIEFHKRSVRVITENQPSMEDILCNVTKPWMPQKCACHAIKERLMKKQPNTVLPEIDGNVMFISRDYTGPNAKALGVTANNIPSQTMWDLAKAWEKVGKGLPSCLELSAAEWKMKLKECLRTVQRRASPFPSTKEVYTLRKDLQGLCVGQLDKNPHELWFCCPTLYRQAWDTMYSEQTGYEKIYPLKRTKKTQSLRHVFQTNPPAKRSAGGEKDIVKAWETLYKNRQWHRYASFDRKGGFCRPYILFKAKNMTDPAVREEKWKKCRPIAPQTKHPMKRLFHLTGRAWSYITSHLESDNFVMSRTDEVPRYLHEAEEKLRGKGEIKYVIKDIESCFTKMPKEAIRLALRSELHKIEVATGYDSVTVPARKTASCSFKPTSRRGYVQIPFEDLAEIAEFALDNTVLTDFDGQLWRQRDGIPMGDSHSPGMCIGTCAWMEHEWLQTVHEDSRGHFTAKRFMDDLLVFYAGLDEEKFLRDISGECYLPPLKLEDGGEATFLETSFKITRTGRIRHWLKNENLAGAPPKTHRYAHFHSHADFSQKRATLTACLKKLQKMASDPIALRTSAVQKLAEFARLKYPSKLLWTACTTMGVNTRDPTWFRVREKIPSA